MHDTFTNSDGVICDRHAPPFDEGEVLTMRNSSPRRIKLLLIGSGDPVMWFGLAGDVVRLPMGTVFDPIPSEGESPEAGAFKYRYLVGENGYMSNKIRE